MDYALSIPRNNSGCIEEYIILDGTNDLLKYYLSNSLDDIQISIYAQTRQNIKLEKACWKINPALSISVKHSMTSHGMNYAMTIIEKDKKLKRRILVVNMRYCDKWLSTIYEELYQDFFCREQINAMRYLLRYLKSADNAEDDDE